MDDNQLILVSNSAERFATDMKDLARLRAQRGKLPGYDTALLKEYGAMGWLAILVPEDYGGLGLGFQEMAAVVRALGKSLLAEPLTATAVLATRALLHSGNEEIKQQLLAEIGAGTFSIALAWQEAGGLDPEQARTQLREGADGPQLHGRKRFIAGASAADNFLVTARTDEGVGLYLIERSRPELQLSYEWRSDGTPAGVLELDGVPVRAVVAPPGRAVPAVERAIDEAAIIASAEMLGVMDATLAMTLEYMRVRVQYGKPIGSFQALQHRAVDLHILKEISAAALQRAVESIDADPAGRTLQQTASRLKSRCSDAGLRLTREAIQIHGAIGFTDEYELGLYVKRALVLSAWLGNGATHRQRLSQLLKAGKDIA